MKTKFNKSRRHGRDVRSEASERAAALPSSESTIGRAWASGPAASGFTLLEVMIATVLFGLVVAGTIEIYIMCNKLWHATSLIMQTTRESSLALSRVIYGMETNNGLRSAAMVVLQTNVPSHWNGIKYWETATNPPPSATNTAHYTHVGCSIYTPDGSWRLTFSNAYGGVKCIDYNTVSSHKVNF